ncbi:hypothetical protein F3Y22_tig00110584pilonHSYRG00158 [Hibiscus syriacus]|uniref:Uncharacterized protein n=1 Tax=Hibiscus syriacus TaxID=106335 RepID=A0A6A3A5C5_HIBSY|nr:hypothetical protein F3Y22_tig00110584pilonHSYRG00158 [Hibiscus syriacus]
MHSKSYFDKEIASDSDDDEKRRRNKDESPSSKKKSGSGMKNSRMRSRTSTVAVTTCQVNTVRTTRQEDTGNTKAAEVVKEGLTTMTEMIAVMVVHNLLQANPKFNVAIRDGRVVLARADPSDERQMKRVTRVFPDYLATGEALKHNNGEAQPVELAPYKPNECNTTLIWSGSKVIENEGYKAIRAVDNQDRWKPSLMVAIMVVVAVSGSKSLEGPTPLCKCNSS